MKRRVREIAKTLDAWVAELRVEENGWRTDAEVKGVVRGIGKGAVGFSHKEHKEHRGIRGVGSQESVLTGLTGLRWEGRASSAGYITIPRG